MARSTSAEGFGAESSGADAQGADAQPSHRRPLSPSAPQHLSPQPQDASRSAPRLLGSSALLLLALALAAQPTAANLLPENVRFQSALAAHTYTPPSGQWLQQQPAAYPAATAPVYPAAQPAYQAPGAQPVGTVAMNPSMVPGGLPANGQLPPPAVGALPAPMAEPAQPPLVTDESVDEAKKLYPGQPVDVLTHRNAIRMAALHRQLAVYRKTPSWVYITTFLAMVGGVIVGFFYLEKVWRQRQDEEDSQ